MSLITSVVLITAGPESAALDAINGWLAANDHYRQQLEAIPMEAAGGVKVIGTDIYAAGFNYLDVEGLVAVIMGAPWQTPTLTVAYFEGETDDDPFVISPGRPGKRWKTRP